MNASKRRRVMKVEEAAQDSVETRASSGHVPIRVLAIEPADILAQTLPIALAADPGLHVETAAVEREAVLAHVRCTPSDVVLLGDSFPDTELAGLVSDLLAAAPNIKVVILSETVDEAVLSACVRAGAVGYMTWQQSPAELIQAIKRANAGDMLVDNHVLLRLLQSVRQDPPRSRPVAALAPREIVVLQYVMAGFRNEEIARHLGISVHTVRAHLHNAMVKLRVHSRLEAAIAALRAGMVKLPEGFKGE